MAATQRSLTQTFDRIGVTASAVCFVHCLAAPVALSLLAVYAHFLPSEEGTHRVLAMVVTLAGSIALGLGYRRHKRGSVLGLMAAGLSLIFAAAFFGDHLPSHWLEVMITLAGSCCMIAAHRLNHTFCKACTTCQ